MIQKSSCPVSPYVTLTLTACTKPWLLCFLMYNVWSSQRKQDKGSKSLFTQFPSGLSSLIQPSHSRNSAGRVIRLSIAWTGRLARHSLQGGEWRRAQLCRCPSWEGLALTEWPQLGASTQLTHPHLSSVPWDAANSSKPIQHTQPKWRRKNIRKKLLSFNRHY